MQKPEELARRIAELAEDEKAIDTQILDIAELTIIADYFVICSGRNVIHVKSIAENIEQKMRADGLPPVRREGLEQGRWAVMDFGSVIVHVFREEEREYYNLEDLWRDAPRLQAEGR